MLKNGLRTATAGGQLSARSTVNYRVNATHVVFESPILVDVFHHHYAAVVHEHSMAAHCVQTCVRIIHPSSPFATWHILTGIAS